MAKSLRRIKLRINNRRFRTVKKMPKTKKKSTALATRAQGERVPAQGVGATVRRAFGARDSVHPSCWDARMPHHLPLPRSVGPYTVVRLTKRMSTGSPFVIFGTFRLTAGSSLAAAGQWSGLAAVGAVNMGSAVNAASNTLKFAYDTTNLEGAATLVPSAVTVQVMNPDALQTTTGILYGGVMKTQLPIANNTATWQAVADGFVQYMNPRMCSAGKLALRGVQASSYPLNMSSIADFTPIRNQVDGTDTYDSDLGEPNGWAPICVYNPGGIGLEYLVTTEYRVRFEFSNVASSTHRHHPVSTDSAWDWATRRAAAMGAGLNDIPQVLANVGQFASTAYRAAQAVGLVSAAEEASLAVV